jgi:DNA polymerase III subunit chi
MTRVDFYFNATDKFDVMRKLASKAVAVGQYVLINANSSAHAKEMDRLLWTTQPLSFLPHVLCEHVLASDTPVLIGQTPEFLARPDVVINMASAVPEWLPRFDRLLDVVSQDPEDKELARYRFRFLKDQGYQITVHDLVSSARS